jgi:hypothetical protein
MSGVRRGGWSGRLVAAAWLIVVSTAATFAQPAETAQALIAQGEALRGGAALDDALGLFDRAADMARRDRSTR